VSDLTYNGSSGWSGTDTSQERAEQQDADGMTGRVQRLVLRFVIFSGSRGETIADLRRILPHLHHGSLSSALTNLHRAGKIARLSEKRGRCKVYVHPRHVDGRDTEPPTRRQKVESRAVYTLLPEDFEDRAGRPLTETELRYAVKGVETVVGDALDAIVEAVLDD
jgi:hypothetical protein